MAKTFKNFRAGFNMSFNYSDFNNIEGNPPTVKSDKKANNNSKNAASKGGIYI